MNSTIPDFTALTRLPPKVAAEKFAALQREKTFHGNRKDRQPASPEQWLDEFATHLEELRAGQSLRRILAIWGLNQSQAARAFGVSRQVFHKWLGNGAPAEISGGVADLGAATDLLLHYLKRERIPAVVRRPMPKLKNKSLLELLGRGKTRAVLSACRDMFDFQAMQH